MQLKNKKHIHKLITKCKTWHYALILCHSSSTMSYRRKTKFSLRRCIPSTISSSLQGLQLKALEGATKGTVAPITPTHHHKRLSDHMSCQAKACLRLTASSPPSARWWGHCNPSAAYFLRRKLLQKLIYFYLKIKAVAWIEARLCCHWLPRTKPKLPTGHSKTQCASLIVAHPLWNRM